MSGPKLTFVKFREVIAKKLAPSKGSHPHVKSCQRAIGNTDWEGPGIAVALHETYEEYYLEWSYFEAGSALDGFMEWWDEEGREVVADNMIDAHPGLCPEDAVKAVFAAVGSERWSDQQTTATTPATR